jgi:hypothetical protein
MEKLASLDRKTTCHGLRRTIHDGKQPAVAKSVARTQVMLQCLSDEQVFLLSPQSSELSPYFSGYLRQDDFDPAGTDD